MIFKTSACQYLFWDTTPTQDAIADVIYRASGTSGISVKYNNK